LDAIKFVMKALVMPLLWPDPVNHAYHFLVGNRAALPGMLLAVIGLTLVRTLVELHVGPDPGTAGGADMTVTHAERDRMARELGRLAIDQRAVMVLHFYIDLPLTEVADILDTSVSAVETLLVRGKQNLRRALSGTIDKDE
jgi:DNA-directed RNA polymerase specialized sigma24 family protein